MMNDKADRSSRWLLAFAFLIGTFAIFPQKSEGAQRIRLGTIVPKGSSFYNEVAKMGADWKARTQREVSLTIYPDGRMGTEAEMVRRMRVGQLQAGLLTAVGLAEIEPAVSGLQNLPMMFDTLDEVDAIGIRLKPLLEDQLEKKGFKVLFWVNAGWVYFFTKSPIEKPDDLRMLKIFAWAGSPEVIDIYEKAGFTPVPLEVKEILTGLQTGMISAVAMQPTYANALLIHRKARFMLDLNWAPLIGAAVITTKTWNRLDPKIKKIVSELALDTGNRIQSAGRKESALAIEAMKRRGLKIKSISEEIKNEWREAAEAVYPQIRGTIVPEDVFDQVSNWIAELRAK